ncbi:MAG: DNA mismatch repair endonuclease MutL, partial [Clostridia bacterium]|nr:DNA mismatch repair endonuclease MutL [Clostridia bacterium]
KYLRPDKKEESDITNLVTRFILGKPKVAFRYYVDGKLVMNSDGDGFDESVARVYGAKTIANCYKIDVEENGLHIYGFIGNQNFFKPNKTYQTTFLNGRYIINNTVSTAVSRCYAAYAMKRQYPFYVLNIDVPPQFVDVNVHPNKMDVRLLNAHSVFSLIYGALTSILDGTASAAKFVTESVRMPEIKSTKEQQSMAEIPSIQPISFSPKPQTAEPAVQPTNQGKKYFDPFEQELFTDFEPKNNEKFIYVSNDSIPTGLGMDPRVDEAYERRKYEQQMIDYESFKYKGNLFNTYLMYEVCDTVYIIDQHAAHERLIYDRLREKMTERRIERQILLEPYLFGTNAQEAEFIENNIRLIRSLGFDLKPFGSNAYRVDEVPMDLQHINIEEFFNELLADLKNLSEIKLEDILKDKIAMTACKHAIKGGMELTDDEVSQLFKMLKGNMGLKCPHGRPICVSLEKKDLEKMFKRIV